MGLRTVGVLAGPVAGHGTPGQAEGGAVKGDHRADFGQRIHHLAPGEDVGGEAVQQQQCRLALADDLVVHLEAIDLSEAAVGVGQLLGRHGALQRTHGNEKRASQQDDQHGDDHDENHTLPTTHDSLYLA